ncbi:nucleoside phosphatase family-domain-containing protein [Amylocarpus encephaloides]|uniref:Nucleoside phosphatase family-domain-containing protein n=1 Tax=Amylocarpus encephaloides TaxID=45428 RepID=A0A9P7Y8I1_9HELO|nr:nucleoside phosphatase family-domain-containing protein [Amylocarpus encephaloides]
MGKWRWGVILDAGSSGTRVHVYKWLNNAKVRHDAKLHELTSLPKLITDKHYTKKDKPGVSTWGDNPTAVGTEHIQQFLDHALKYVPADQVQDTPIFLMATAGVRLLEPMKQKALLNEICVYAQTHSEFSLPDCGLHIQVIPGETEGLYGWIAANYLLGGFDSPDKHQHGKGHHTYGFLDMGGASAQIAFAPNSTEAEKHADDLKLLRMRTINGESSEYKVFTTTWLGFGVNQARERYVETLKEGHLPDAHEMVDPCLPSGLITTLKGDRVLDNKGKDPVLVGTGKFSECVGATYPLLDKDAPCADPPCLLYGQHVPAIDFGVNHFVGVSEYWHTTHEFFEMAHKDKAYNFDDYQRLVKDFCAAEWDDIKEDVAHKKWGKKVKEKNAQEVCFKAAWLINVLHDGIGVPRAGIDKTINAPGYNKSKELTTLGKDRAFLDPFQAVNRIDGMEVSWTLGKMLLYAAGQIPPSRPQALPVGFGSNVAGGVVPTDFQEAGSNSRPVPASAGDDWTEVAEDLAEKAHRSTPTLLFIVFILAFLGYVFRKRERRLRLYRGVGTTFRRNRRPGSPRKGGRGFFGAGKLFGRSSAHYERVLEDGEAAGDFELGEVTDSEDNDHSDSSEESRIGRASGLATPRMNVMNFDMPGASYFDSAPAGQGGVGLGLNNGSGILPNAMDRSGLVVRTESRERLAPMLGAGRRSRAGSPTRLKSPLMTPVEEV